MIWYETSSPGFSFKRMNQPDCMPSTHHFMESTGKGIRRQAFFITSNICWERDGCDQLSPNQPNLKLEIRSSATCVAAEWWWLLSLVMILCWSYLNSAQNMCTGTVSVTNCEILGFRWLCENFRWDHFSWMLILVKVNNDQTVTVYILEMKT